MHWVDNVKAREQVEWMLLRLGVSRRNVFDDLVIGFGWMENEGNYVVGRVVIGTNLMTL